MMFWILPCFDCNLRLVQSGTVYLDRSLQREINEKIIWNQATFDEKGREI